MAHSTCEEPKYMHYHELQAITEFFNNELGRGGFGAVYKGKCEDKPVAVKVLLERSQGNQDKEFKEELLHIAKLSHPNIIRLVGYCCETYEKYNHRIDKLEPVTRTALCFEYAPNGNLRKYTLDEHRLDWPKVYNIIKGTCKGLYYLYHHSSGSIWHLDLKPENILLDHNMDPKIADFGLSKLFTSPTTKVLQIGGTTDYVPLEYKLRSQVTRKFDIFSLGVIIIEVMAGTGTYRTIDDFDSYEDVVKIVLEMWNDVLSGHCKQVKSCIEIALKCVDIKPKNRPELTYIIDELNKVENVVSPIHLSQNSSTYDGSSTGEILRTLTKSGPWGGSAGTARDIKEIPWRLESLTIGYLGLVDAFSFSYIDQDGNKQTLGPWGEGYSGDKIETIWFGPSEFLEEVWVTYGSHFENDLVMSLTFVTNVKAYGPFGNPYHQNVPATHFRFMADEDSSIVGFHGSSGTHLYSIGVYSCPSNKTTVRSLPAPLVHMGQSLTTRIGPWGGSTSGNAHDIEKPWRLKSLTISYSGLVDAFSFSYIDQEGKRRSAGPWGQGYHYDEIETILFDPWEFVQEVSGAYGNHHDDILVTSLKFVTNAGTYGPFGNPHHQNVPATPFRFRAEEGSQIVGFHGRSSRFLNAIGVYTMRITEL